VLPDGQRWNHNLEYHRLILDAVPPGARRGLDVGCGEGILTRRLRERIPDVTGIDVDRASLELARRQDTGGDIEYILADFLRWPCEPASFDVIASVAALHHTTRLRRRRH
jgi:2-polyprenyl-3-methyl-5-hydroxy-6-metoxy-1,4-benzoquinol methylase